MTVQIFEIRSRAGGQLLGQAVICEAARYASVMRTTSPYPARRFPSADQWKAVAHELAHSVPPAQMAGAKTVAQVLLGAHAALVDLYHVSQERLPAGTPAADAVVDLDERLRVIQEEVGSAR